MDREDAITRAQLPPSSRENPLTPIIVGIVVIIIAFALVVLFFVIIPMSAEQGVQGRSERLEEAVNLAEKQAMENVNETGSIYPKEPSITMSPELLTLEKPFDAVEEQEERT